MYTLSVVPPRNDVYWDAIRRWAADLNSDGCTAVKDWYLDACLEHDCHWRTAKTLWGDTITTKQANERFRAVMQSRSRLGRYSPVSWVRWVGVTIASPFLGHATK